MATGFYVASEDRRMFWNGSRFSWEFPDAKLYNRRSDASVGLQIAQGRTTITLVIVDRREEN